MYHLLNKLTAVPEGERVYTASRGQMMLVETSLDKRNLTYELFLFDTTRNAIGRKSHSSSSSLPVRRTACHILETGELVTSAS